MCEFHESTCNGFGDIWWTDNPIYFSSIDGQAIANAVGLAVCIMLKLDAPSSTSVLVT